MKYAKLYWQDTEQAGGIRTVNIGDNLQLFVFDYLYQRFFPKETDVVKLRMRELKDYQGECAVLPMNWSLFESRFMAGDKIAISDRIIPIFLAATIEASDFRQEYLNEDNIAYLKRYEPIGCRDAFTADTLRQHGIRAYLNGCMTSVFPKRSANPNQKKVFFVDAPVGLRDYIPQELTENCEIMTQQYYYPNDIAIDQILAAAKAQYQKYADEARLVVTSRLHVTSFCLATGIPVIFAKDKLDGRLGWIDSYIPLYDQASYDKIDWSPQPVELEDAKSAIIHNAVARIKNTFETYASAHEIDRIYRDVNSSEYAHFPELTYGGVQTAALFLQKRFAQLDHFTYSIWGVGKSTEALYQFIQSEYPNGALRCVIDTYKVLEFHGVKTIKPDDFCWEAGEVVIVLPVKASGAAEEFFSSRGIDSRWYVCCGNQFLKERDISFVQAANRRTAGGQESLSLHLQGGSQWTIK